MCHRRGETEKLILYLEAEEPNGVDDVVLSGGPDSRQNRGHVVHPDTEEEEEAQQMAPDIHRLIGQNEEAAQRIYFEFEFYIFLFNVLY